MIDFTSGGIFAAILGTNNISVRVAMNTPDILASYAHHHPSKWTLRYIDMLKEWTGFESVALFSTGAEATEAFWRCCRVYNGRPGVWGGLVDPDLVGKTDPGPPCDAMHGVTLGALIMAGRMTWQEIGVFPELGVTRFGQTPDSTSCMIIEPYHAPSAQFHRINPTINRIKALQKEFTEMPLCIDEVQGGFGRTGKKFAYQWYKGIKPDFITIGKGCGGGLPLSALLGPKEIMESKIVKKYAHLHSTHSGHPIMCSVGCVVIEEIERLGLIDRSQHLGVMLKNLLKGCGVRFHAGRGLMAGLEFNGPDEADRVAQLCSENGLCVCPTGRKWVKLGPQLTITEEDLEKGVAILREAIARVINERKTDTETCGDFGNEPRESSSDISADGVSAPGSGDNQSIKDDGCKGADD